jgi:hypothetical protein
MSRLTAVLTIAGALAIAPAMRAQGPTRPQGPPPNGVQNGPPNGRMGGPPMGPRVPDAASMLLAHTGDFKLTDAQVTRLAAIARRTADRRKTMMASMDSMRSANMAARQAQPTPPGGAMRQGPPPAAQAQAAKMREQNHIDLRDALAVLTPDQQAQAWEMVAMRGGGPGGRGRGMGGGRGQRRPPADSL